MYRPEGPVAWAAHRQEIQVGPAARRQEVEPVFRLAGQPGHRPLGYKTGQAVEGASLRAGQATRRAAGQSAQEVEGWGLCTISTPQPGAREGEADNGTWCSRAQLATQLPTLRSPFNTVKRRGLDQRSSFVKTTALAILCHLHRLTFSLSLHWVQRRRDISNRISIGNCSTALSVAG